MGSRSYRRREPDLPGGDFSSKATGLALGVRPGNVAGTEAPWLRWLTTDGALVMSSTERADAERLRADAAAARVAELEARLGIKSTV